MISEEAEKYKLSAIEAHLLKLSICFCAEVKGTARFRLRPMEWNQKKPYLLCESSMLSPMRERTKREHEPLTDRSPVKSPFIVSCKSFSELSSERTQLRDNSKPVAYTSISSPLPTPVFFFKEKTFSQKKDRQLHSYRPPPTPKPHLENSGVFSCSRLNLRPQSVSFIDEGTPLSSEHYNENSDQLYFQQCFSIISKLGSGSFGDVFKVRSKEDGKYYAIKRSKDKFCGPSDRLRKMEEVKKHERLPKHQNCVQFFKAWEERRRLYIQLELCEFSLSQFSELNHNIPESTVWDYLVDLSLAVKHLHDHDFVHLDVKPENIFVSHNGICKLGDFGLMLDVSKKDLQDPVEGDSKYLAPELLQGVFTKAADVFSLGITILELACDLDLPQGDTAWHQLRERQMPLEFLQVISTELIEVIKSMMEPDHRIRPTIDSVLKMDAVCKVYDKRKLVLKTKKESVSTDVHNSSSSGWEGSISDGDVFEPQNSSSEEIINSSSSFGDIQKSLDFDFDRSSTEFVEQENSFDEFLRSPTFDRSSERKISTGKLNPRISSSPKFSRRRLPFVSAKCDDENVQNVRPQNLMNLFDEQVSDNSF